MEIGNGSTNAGERLTEFSGNSQEKRKYQNNSYGLDKKSTVWSKVACLKQQICRKQSSSRSLLLFNSECLNVPARFLGVLDYLTMCCRNSCCLIHAPILDNLKTLISNHRCEGLDCKPENLGARLPQIRLHGNLVAHC